MAIPFAVDVSDAIQPLLEGVLRAGNEVFIFPHAQTIDGHTIDASVSPDGRDAVAVSCFWTDEGRVLDGSGFGLLHLRL